MRSRFMTIALGLWCFLTLLLVYIHKWLYHWFGSISLKSMLTYLNLPRTGVESFYLYDLLVTVLPVFPLTALFVALLVLVRRGRLWRHSPSSVFFLAVSGMLMAWVLKGYAIEYNHNVYDTLRFRGTTSRYYEEHYCDVDPDRITFPERKRNLLLLVIESLEGAISDPMLFGTSLVPDLDSIRRGHPHVDFLVSTEGTGSTMPAFTAFLYGVPLIYPSQEDGRYYAFRPKTPSLLRILEDNGYSVAFLRGANALHNGMESLIERDTIDGRLYDLRYFLKNDPALAEDSNLWGLSDSYIFARAKEFLPKAAEEQPFAFVILTVNTHKPCFYEDSLPRVHGDERDSYVQVDGMASDFLRWAGAQPWAEDTVIVVLGDHPTHMRLLGPVHLPMDNGKRTIFNTFINHDPALSLRQPDRIAGSWDVAPTILEAVGATLPQRRFGLGTSLFSPQTGLLELMGLERHNAMVMRRSEKYRQLFWQPVDSRDELSKWITHDAMVPEVAAKAVHGGGTIDGRANTNSLEAVLASIADGHEYIGVDLQTTSDGRYVGAVSWETLHHLAGRPERGGEPQALEEVRGYRLLQKYTPLTSEEMVRILQEHERVKFVVDGVDDYARLAAEIPVPERLYVSVYAREEERRALEAGLNPVFHKDMVDMSFEAGED